jgi:hypothetical protein
MKQLPATLLAFTLAGCAGSGHFDREKPITLVAPTEQVLPPVKPLSRKSLAARADASKEASKTDANDSTDSSSLMECMSDACKIQCSSQVEKQSKPKWCMYFKKSRDQENFSALRT